MSLGRRLDWPERMAEEISAAAGRPFRWGGHDCALFACDVVLAMTGTDLADGFRGTYSSAGEAAMVIQEAGGTLLALAERLAAGAGISEISLAYARRGDVVLVSPETPGSGEALAVCEGRWAAAATRPAGVARVGLDRWLKAWRI